MTITLIRGAPGSGKSTAARTMKGVMHFETDTYFMREGLYDFDPAKLTEAHAWCLKAAKYAVAYGRSVVVSNTFTRRWELQPYIDLATATGVELVVYRCTGDYGSVHSVPEATV